MHVHDCLGIAVFPASGTFENVGCSSESCASAHGHSCLFPLGSRWYEGVGFGCAPLLAAGCPPRLVSGCADAIDGLEDDRAAVAVGSGFLVKYFVVFRKASTWAVFDSIAGGAGASFVQGSVPGRSRWMKQE